MFTGIVEERGEVLALDLADEGADARLTVRGPKVTSDVHHGDSIAVSGVCLTVVASGDGTFTADLMHETLERTSAKDWAPGAAVNLERSVPAGGRLGGHVVQGHVDGVGTVIARTEHPGYDEFRIAVPGTLARYLAPKGAVAVDGISLTVIDVVDTATGRRIHARHHSGDQIGHHPRRSAARPRGQHRGRRAGEIRRTAADVQFSRRNT